MAYHSHVLTATGAISFAKCSRLFEQARLVNQCTLFAGYFVFHTLAESSAGTNGKC
jgi:hypothetical protein